MFTLGLDSPALGATRRRLAGHLDAGEALVEAAGVAPQRAGARIADALAGTVVTCPAC